MLFHKVLEKYRQYSFSERDKGDRFERLMQAYLITDPQYASKIQKVWIWSEFPYRKDFGGKDTGIDLVVLTNEGDYWAIQCKCYQDSSNIDKPAVDSFLSTSSREFVDAENRTVKFSHRLWISTTNKWGSNAEEAIRNQNPAVSRINLYDLEQAPVDWGKLEIGISGDKASNILKEPNVTLVRNELTDLVKNSNLTAAVTLRNNDNIFIEQMNLLYLVRDSRGAVVSGGTTTINGFASGTSRDLNIEYTRPLDRIPRTLEIRWSVNYLDSAAIRLP